MSKRLKDLRRIDGNRWTDGKLIYRIFEVQKELTPGRLLAIDKNGRIVSAGTVNLGAVGTANQIIITTDASGGVLTLSTPQDIDTNADVVFDSATLNDLTASRLTQTDANKKLQSVANLAAWIAGTANQVLITDDTDGTITLAFVNPTRLASAANISAGNYSEFGADGTLSFNGTARIGWQKITANSVTLSAGSSASTVSDLQTANDGNVFTIQEAGATPGIDLIVDFINVDAFNWVKLLAVYDEGAAAVHAMPIQLYNWSTASWDNFCAFQNGISNSGTIFDDHSFFVPDDTNYIGTGGNDGKVRVKYYHPQPGNAAHYLYIDETALYQ